MINKKQHTVTGKIKYSSSSSPDVLDILLKNKKFIKASKNKGKVYNTTFSKTETEEEIELEDE